MYSSRMRTVHSSLGLCAGGLYPGGLCPGGLCQGDPPGQRPPLPGRNMETHTETPWKEHEMRDRDLPEEHGTRQPDRK